MLGTALQVGANSQIACIYGEPDGWRRMNSH
jgi:hypothetical protein